MDIAKILNLRPTQRFSVRQAAELLDIDESTVRRKIRRGELRCNLTGFTNRYYLRTEDLQRYIRKVYPQ